MLVSLKSFLTGVGGRHYFNFSILLVGLLLPGLTATARAADAPAPWWSPAAAAALDDAGTNRAALVEALDKVPAAQREGMDFLIANMPAVDRQQLSADLLLKDVALAYAGWEQAPWHDQIPPEIFLNDVLPYATVNETRDDWRQLLIDKCTPLVAGCRTPGEAALRLNEKLFPLTGVHYSTARKRADQSALETLDSKLASCTGLSILLVDACRAVGVPARLAGTPMWTDNSGNHSWVEVWDGGRWHFVGASEPDAKGLDHGWFEQKAAQAKADEPKYAIYASSFKKTGLIFPLDWAPDLTYINAVNVTDRYAQEQAKPAAEKVRLLVKVLDHPKGKRVAAAVTVTAMDDPAVTFSGTSRDESADLNNVQTFDLDRSHLYQIDVVAGKAVVHQAFCPGAAEQETAVVYLSDSTTLMPADFKALTPRQAAKLRATFDRYFAANAREQSDWNFTDNEEECLRQNEPEVRQLAWKAYLAAPSHGALQSDFQSDRVRFQDYVSPYTVKIVGQRPANGWPVFIAMHGGGGVEKEVNDSQWRIMQKYYRDHPELGGYLYVALRAPNDTWNGFYDDYVYPLIDNLTREFRLFGDADPNKFFIMGYSHGGYGAFAIGPKIPDHFAAIHASAGAPTDGETTGVTLRNTRFTCMVGELDTMYGRHDRDLKFQKEIAQLRGDRTDIYPVTVTVIAGNGHTGLPDRDKITTMYSAVRDPVPRELTWLQTDRVVTDFFWLQCPNPAKQHEIDATCRDNHLTIITTNVSPATVYLDRRLVDFSRPVMLDYNGKTAPVRLRPSLRTLCATLQQRGDPDLAFTARVELP
ncbi:MAG TPA: transglutaminase domain-containing protein [Dongiaceae bacterium]|nr:transglutaminase domain-containing protein [Dongiaceae bacterium]